ncbi:MAG: class I SAM-dependent methyltransferase [Anaerolineales bacterium]
MIRTLANKFSMRSRKNRGRLFIRYMKPSPQDKILDLGSGTGSHLSSIIPYRENIFIADINQNQLDYGKQKYGYKPVQIKESGRLPFSDHFFDIVFCSSVIEHVTVPKNEVYKYRTHNTFFRVSIQSQLAFANEIQRIGKNYFVQTPNKYFLIESHTWMPLLFVLLPRNMQIKLIDFLNLWWPKKTTPDWNLLTTADMQRLFPKAEIVHEKLLGITKSIMAIKGK